MTLEEVKNELKAFDKFTFEEESHTYYCNGKKIGIGATGLIEQYAQPFEKEIIAARVAMRNNKDIEDVLEEWEYKNKVACFKGSNCHAKAQSLWSGEIYQPNEFDGSEAFKMANNSIYRQAENFYNDFKGDFTHIQDEQLVGDEECDLCSAIDHMFLDKKGNVWIIDYKTNSYMSGYNKKAYKKNMQHPLQHLNDDALNHYKIQLSMYKYLVEKHTNIKIFKTIIVYMSENINNYEIIEVPYLKNEVEELLERRKWLE